MIKVAGFFGFFDYTKPGKGVEADEPEKRALFRYLDIIWHKKGKMIAINFMYFVCILPIILAFHLFVFEPFFMSLLPEGEEYTGSLFVAMFSFIFDMPQALLIGLLVLSIFLMGPATCGLTYILRNFVRHEHAWISDFWQRAKSNFKQGVLLGILDALMFYVGFFNISLLFFGTETEIPFFITAASIVVFIFYLGMRNTTYLMAVTVELSNIQLIRNSIILTFAGLPRHLLTGLIYTVYIVLILLTFNFVELLILPLIGLSLLGLTSVFNSYPLIYKFLIKPQLEIETEIETDENEILE